MHLSPLRSLGAGTPSTSGCDVPHASKWQRGLATRGPHLGSRLPARAWPLNGLFGDSADKTLHLIRHGTTEMNVHLGRCSPGYGQPGFVDPLLYDTVLTEGGRAQAAAAARSAARLSPPPEVLVVSPLTRALQTAELVFSGVPALPRESQPLAAERLYLSSDVGRPRSELESAWPHVCFKRLPDDDGAWWHSDDESDDLLEVLEEPEDVFLARVERLRQWLAGRPESSIALVSHWGVLRALTGRDFDNCEVRTLPLRRLKARPQLLAGEGRGAMR